MQFLGGEESLRRSVLKRKDGALERGNSEMRIEEGLESKLLSRAGDQPKPDCGQLNGRKGRERGLKGKPERGGEEKRKGDEYRSLTRTGTETHLSSIAEKGNRKGANQRSKTQGHREGVGSRCTKGGCSNIWKKKGGRLKKVGRGLRQKKGRKVVGSLRCLGGEKGMDPVEGKGRTGG